jgi:hypothetical protein
MEKFCKKEELNINYGGNKFERSYGKSKIDFIMSNDQIEKCKNKRSIASDHYMVIVVLKNTFQNKVNNLIINKEKVLKINRTDKNWTFLENYNIAN